MKRSIIVLILLNASFVGPRVYADDESDLQRDASWDYPASAVVRAEFDIWVAEQNLDEEVVAQIDELWQDTETDSADNSVDAVAENVVNEDDGIENTISREFLRRELALRVIATIRLVAPESGAFIDACHTIQPDVGRYSMPEFMLVQDEATPAVVRDNLRLLFGAWLADHRLYDEAILQLEPIPIENVADPAKLLFYKAASHYRLRNREEGLAAVGKLLEKSGDIPQRYDTVAQLMQSELKALKADSLDEVARIMDSITVRLGHGRAGQRVRQEEDDVIEKLDKMIEELEKKRQQQQQQQKDGKGGKKPSKPMQNSVPAGGSGPGNVDPKKLDEEIDWGDLPPKQREEALQRLGTEFPSHYREVIEEYFRKLARQESETP